MAKSVGKNHPEYKEVLAVARKMRALDKGTRAIKDGGEEFLCRDARFSNDENGDCRYENFKKRAQLIEAIRPTRRLILSRLLEQAPEFNVPDKIQNAFGGEVKFKKMIMDLSRWVASQLIIAGRAGLAVEVIASESNEIALKFFRYKSESIVNWRGSGDADNSDLSLFVAAQEVKANPSDIFCHDVTKQRLVEYIDAEGARVSEVHQKNDTKDQKDDGAEDTAGWSVIAETIKNPTILGSRATFLPFHIFTTEDGLGCSSPILEAMGETVLSAFETSAWHRNHLSLYGTPTAYVAQDPTAAEETETVECAKCSVRCTQEVWNECGGCKACDWKHCNSCGDGDVQLGSNDILMLAGASAKAGFLEPSGTGAKDLADELKRQQEQIVSQGAKMFKQLVNVNNKTATAENNEEKSDTDAITDLSNSVDRGMLVVLIHAARLLNISEAEIEKIEFSLSKSYKDTKIPWAEIAKVIEDWVAGNIPLGVVLQIMKEAGYIKADMTEEDYLKAVSEFEFEPKEDVL